MSDWKNVVCVVERLEKHINSDNLSIATVMGDYPVIVKTGDYQVGDLVSYLSIDGIFPDTEEFHFLTPRKIENYEEDGETKSRVVGAKYEIGKTPERQRLIKAKKIRNSYSQGLLMRVPEGFKEGDDVTEYFGLKKWEEPEEEDNTPTKKSVGKNAEKAPTTFQIGYYDIEGIRKVINHFDENVIVAVSEKCHGANFSACFDGDKLWVKSRNWFKREHEEDMWWFGANHAKLKEKLQKYPFLVFYGELTGLVKKFPYNSFVENGERCPVINFFDLYDAKNKVWMSYEDRIRIFKELDLQMAPELYVGKFDKELIYSLAEGNSKLNDTHIKEGVVIDVLSESPFRGCERKYKLIGNNYNLQK